MRSRPVDGPYDPRARVGRARTRPRCPRRLDRQS